MPRRRTYDPLRVMLNHRLVGHLAKEPDGALRFQYAEEWLDGRLGMPVSLSLPLREDAYRGEAVAAVFDNLLPDGDLRRRVAERVGAAGEDAYSLLREIGGDCVGALRFLPEGVDTEVDFTRLEGDRLSDREIEKMLGGLAQAPLGLDREGDFRISVAGAQEKTALLWHEGQWIKPRGVTPTTHILKKQIGSLPNGIDLSHSVENEYLCLKLLAAFGLRVNEAEMVSFGKMRALVVRRFDRIWIEGKLFRLPQEDLCQALSIPPSRKYQNDGGPGMVDILGVLRGSDTAAEDQRTFLMAQVLFWLIGATDGHAKNFSIFLGEEGSFRLTPIYDVISAQPSLDAHQIHAKQMKLAMFVGDKRHYTMRYICGRHFQQTVQRAGLPRSLATEVLHEVTSRAEAAISAVEDGLPRRFPAVLVESISRGLRGRLQSIQA